MRCVGIGLNAPRSWGLDPRWQAEAREGKPVLPGHLFVGMNPDFWCPGTGPGRAISAGCGLVIQWPQPQPPPQHPPPPIGGSGLKSELLSWLPEMAAKTEMIRRAGCSQTGHSAPSELIGCSLSKLWLQEGQWYSYRGISTPRWNLSGRHRECPAFPLKFPGNI